MSCILCLKVKKESSLLLIHLNSDEAFNLNIKDILMQHFWLQPEEDDFVCRECWNYLFEFHKFYLRVQQAHKDKKTNLESSTFCELEELKVEENAELFGSSIELQEINALEDPISAEFKGDIIEDVSLKLQRESCRKTSRHIKERLEESNDECAVLKRRRGRPPKNLDLKTKEQRVSGRLKREQRDLSVNAINVLVENKKISKKTKEFLKLDKSLSRRDLTQYDDFISENMKLACDICKEDCKDFRNLQVHFSSKHKTRGYVICCGIKLLKRGVLLDHLQTHKDPEYFKCELCNKILANRRCLELHRQNHHQDKGEPKFKCEICSKAFHLKRVCKLHMERHVPEELRKFQCEHCPKRYSSAYLLNNHVKRLHLSKYSRVCDICGKKVFGSEAFRVHQDEHKGIQQQFLNCDICGAKAKTKYDLTRHKKEKHTTEFQMPQQCKLCLKTSPNLMALKRHITFMHKMQRIHNCSICEKSFKRAVDLKEHLQTHSNDTGGLYICTFCPRTFNSSANMYNHRKRMHPEEWAQSRKDKVPNNKTNSETSLQKELNTLLK